MENYYEDAEVVEQPVTKKSIQPRAPSLRKASVDFKIIEDVEKIKLPGKLNYCCLTREELGMDVSNSSPIPNRRSLIPTMIDYPAGSSSRTSGDIQTNKTASRRSLFTNSGFFNTHPSSSKKLVAANSTMFPNYKKASNAGALENPEMAHENQNTFVPHPGANPAYYDNTSEYPQAFQPNPYYGPPSQNPEFVQAYPRISNGKPSVIPENFQNMTNVSNRNIVKSTAQINPNNVPYNGRPSQNDYNQGPQHPAEFQPNPNVYNQIPAQNTAHNERPTMNNGIFLRAPDKSHANTSQDSIYFDPEPNVRNELYRTRTSNGRNEVRHNSTRR